MFDLKNYPLDFDKKSLEPYMSSATIDFHYGKHLATYMKNLNELIAGTEYEKLILPEIVKKSAAAGTSGQKIFNNAAQVFNHVFFFHCLKSGDDRGMPDAIAQHFGGEKQFKDEFKKAALSVFGSGWVWLVMDKDKFKIITTGNADTPIAHNLRPILTLDVWEHAYYLDYQNRRADFIDTFLDYLVHWNYVIEQMKI